MWGFGSCSRGWLQQLRAWLASARDTGVRMRHKQVTNAGQDRLGFALEIVSGTSLVAISGPNLIIPSTNQLVLNPSCCRQILKSLSIFAYIIKITIKKHFAQCCLHLSIPAQGQSTKAPVNCPHRQTAQDPIPRALPSRQTLPPPCRTTVSMPITSTNATTTGKSTITRMSDIHPSTY